MNVVRVARCLTVEAKPRPVNAGISGLSQETATKMRSEHHHDHDRAPTILVAPVHLCHAGIVTARGDDGIERATDRERPLSARGPAPPGERTRLDPGTSTGTSTHTHGEHLSGDSLPSAPRRPLLGRYSLLRKLGEGGMGVVYSAYDEELDRRVAIKLLRVQADGDSSAAPRMLREAQLMAKLSHPNVVQVYDVGVVAHRVFLAMEFVQGATSREWLHGPPEDPRPAPRPWPEVLAMYIQAGHGLAAAHAAGLVHRDFKPDNVLVGVDGRARVLDFGLARSDAHDDLDADSEASGEPLLHSHASRSSRRSTEPPLTLAGTLIGTPAYMSPEQHLRAATDPRSDQFSFCVSLYEGIYGERPFPGRSTSELRASALTGKIRDPPPGRKVPHWLRKVLLRGLKVAAADRFPDMHALLAALAADPGRARRRWLAGAGLVALALTLGLAIAARRSNEVAICNNADRLLVDVWDPARARAVEAALTATGLAYARDTWPRVQEQLDLYARTWQRMHVDVCEATNVHRSQSAALMDLRMTCLAESLDELRTVVDLLAHADAQVAERAVQVATSLRPLARCASTSAHTLVHTAVSPTTLTAVRDIDTLLVQVRAELAAGRYARGLQLAREAVVAADRSGHDPARAEALHHRGLLEAGAADFAAAERSHEAAYVLAEIIGDDLTRLDAATALVELVGERRGRDHDGLQWAQQAEALLHRLADPPDREAPLRANLGIVHTRYARYDQALTALDRAIALGDRPGDPRLASYQRLLGNVYYRKGQYPEAQVAYTRAVELAEAALGPDHPDLGRSLSNLGEAHRVQGHDEDAERCFRRSISIWERTFGPDHPMLAPPYNGLGTLALLRGDTGAAVVHFEHVRLLLERTHGPDHPDVGAVTSNLGEVLLVDGSLAESRRHSERALQILEKALGREHDGLADVLCNLARALVLQGELAPAAVHYARAITLLERTHDPGFTGLAKPLTGQGLLGLAAGRPADAVAPLERALALGVADPGKLAELRLALARALWDAKVDRPRAHALVLQARTDLARARPGPLHTRLADELTRWLGEHASP